VEGEDKAILNRTPIRVTVDPKGEALLPASRLNLAMLYTVEHSIPVAIIGKIALGDIEKLRRYCGEVQEFFSFTDRIEESDEEEE